MEAYFIHVRIRGPLPLPLRYQEHRDVLFVSPNARLAGLSGMAQLESPELAQKFLSLIYPKFQKRYGANIELEIGIGSCKREKEMALVRQHSELVKARIVERNTSSNKAPRVRAADNLLQGRRP